MKWDTLFESILFHSSLHFTRARLGKFEIANTSWEYIWYIEAIIKYSCFTLTKLFQQSLIIHS